jgi:hypothetical protein
MGKKTREWEKRIIKLNNSPPPHKGSRILAAQLALSLSLAYYA